MPVLELMGLDVFYGDAQALTELSLSIEQHEIVALLGANGAGKTTTLRTVSGLLRPRHGSIIFNTQRIDQVPAHSLAGLGIAHIPEGRRLFPAMSVLENLYMGAFRQSAWCRRMRNLEYVTSLFPILAERRRQSAGTLSGGEQQMLAIGRALMSEPRLLMLDEPSLGLAPRLVQQVFEIISTVREHGVAILLVEQNAHMALQIADRGYLLESGRVALEGTSGELLDDPSVYEAYLGS